MKLVILWTIVTALAYYQHDFNVVQFSLDFILAYSILRALNCALSIVNGFMKKKLEEETKDV